MRAVAAHDLHPRYTGFAGAPDDGSGMARDMRVRWALEEVGQRYEVRPIPYEDFRKPAHLALHPFGKIPTYELDSLRLFETGAIVLYIAEHHDGLLPADPAKRGRAIAWMFAAVSTIEPPILDYEVASMIESDEPWTEKRMPLVKDRVRHRLRHLSNYLGDRTWIEDEFTAGDLMTIDVLRRLDGSGLVEEFANLRSYVARGEERPAFKRAFADQREAFEARNTPNLPVA